MTRVEIGFGVGFSADGTPINWGFGRPELKDALDLILIKASGKFGGASLVACKGCWHDLGVPILEDGYILRIDLGLDTFDAVKDAQAFAAFVRSEFKQKSVLFSISRVESELI